MNDSCSSHVSVSGGFADGSSGGSIRQLRQALESMLAEAKTHRETVAWALDVPRSGQHGRDCQLCPSARSDDRAIRGENGDSAEAAALPADESPPVVENPLRIKRLRGREDKALQREAELSRRSVDGQGDAFDAIVQSADWRERDRGRGVQPKAQMREEFPPIYYRSQQWQTKRGADNRTRRHEIQRERHTYSPRHTDEGWLARTMEDLARATPDEAEPFKKRMETVALPPGVRAIFTGNVGESLLEIMRRTGSHAHIVHPDTELSKRKIGLTDKESSIDGYTDATSPTEVDSSSEKISPDTQSTTPTGFQYLKLWGTVKQNSDAMTLLPDLMQAVTGDDLATRRNIEDHDLRYESKPLGTDPASTGMDNSMDRMMARWHEPETNESIEVEDTKVRSDATDEPSSIRSVWVGYQQRELLDVDLLLSQRTGEDRGDDATGEGMVKTQPSSHVHIATDTEFLDIFAPTAAQIMPSRLSITSTIEFAAHIESITIMPARLLRLRLHARKYVSGSPQTHTHTAQTIEKLITLFNDTTYNSYISAEAAESAFHYVVRHRDFPALRAILAALENNKSYTITASNFDVLLAAAAKEEDLLNFRYVLRRMLTRRVKPTWRTWVRLHELVSKRFPDPEAAKRVENLMRERGVLNHAQAMREVVANAVEADLTTHLASSPEANLDSFIAIYDDRYGQLSAEFTNSRLQITASEPREWLTTSTANRMIKVLLSLARVEDALRILQLLGQAGESAEIDTLNTFLATASRSRDASAAVAALKHFEPMLSRHSRLVKLNQRSYEILFHVAWRGQWFNMLRVVWRYACCAGCVSWEMQRRVKDSLISYVPAPRPFAMREEERRVEEITQAAKEARRGSDLNKDLPEAEEGMRTMTWQQVSFGWAGKFAVGVSEEMLSFGSRGSDAMVLTGGEAEILALSAQARSISLRSQTDADLAEDGGATSMHHRRRRKRLLAFLRADLAETMSLRPPVPFGEMLEKAWQKDVRWKRRGLGHTTAELFENAEVDGSGGLEEEEKARRYAKMFEEMLLHGVRVPVIVGRMG
ncbi:hypothetical protein LTR08_000738 [Meristemomyces frigidus]|nr:hypothetical protein LTR08_000738 [Meristemomyces frigidus]